MRVILANINHCAVTFLSRAATNLCWYHCMKHITREMHILYYYMDNAYIGRCPLGIPALTRKLSIAMYMANR